MPKDLKNLMLNKLDEITNKLDRLIDSHNNLTTLVNKLIQESPQDEQKYVITSIDELRELKDIPGLGKKVSIISFNLITLNLP